MLLLVSISDKNLLHTAIFSNFAPEIPTTSKSLRI